MVSDSHIQTKIKLWLVLVHCYSVLYEKYNELNNMMVIGNKWRLNLYFYSFKKKKKAIFINDSLLIIFLRLGVVLFFLFFLKLPIKKMDPSNEEQNDTTNLYITLNLTKAATPEEIKKVCDLLLFHSCFVELQLLITTGFF